MVGDDGFVDVVARGENEILRPIPVRCRHRLSAEGECRDSSRVERASGKGDSGAFRRACVRMGDDAHGRSHRIHGHVRLGVGDGSRGVGKRYEDGFFAVARRKRYVELVVSRSGNASGDGRRHVAGDFVVDGFEGGDHYGRGIRAHVRSTQEFYRSVRGNDRFSNRSERDGAGISNGVHYERGVVDHAVGEGGEVEVGRKAAVVPDGERSAPGVS